MLCLPTKPLPYIEPYLGAAYLLVLVSGTSNNAVCNFFTIFMIGLRGGGVATFLAFGGGKAGNSKLDESGHPGNGVWIGLKVSCLDVH